MNKTDRCPCHSGESYSACCGPLHNGRSAPTPLALMRARYAAYALGNIRFVLQTQLSPENQPPAEWGQQRKELKTFSRQTTFAGLQILDAPESGPDDVEGTITFRAVLLQGERDASFVERSLFRKINGRWRYVGPV